MKKIILNTIQKTSPNYKKFYALVSNKDYYNVIQYNWYIAVRKITYARTYRNGKSFSMHNLIMKAKGIDHKNGNGLHNYRSNLRIVNDQQNQANCISRIGTSKYKGVSWNKSKQKWSATITYNYKSIFLGYFKSETDAANAYNIKAKNLFGKYAKLNQL